MLDELISYFVRVIVLNRIEKHPRNPAWERFASERDRMPQGLEHYRARHRDSAPRRHWKLLEHLYWLYRHEAPTMAYTTEQPIRDTHQITDWPIRGAEERGLW